MTDPNELDRLADDGCPHHPESYDVEKHRCPGCGEIWAGCVCPLTDEEERLFSEEMHRLNDPHYIAQHDLDREPDEFFDDGEEDIECADCGGRGIVTSPVGPGIRGSISMDCPECGGTGWL
jgi:hypothetical protein